jgi:hypothetical protein
MIDSDMAASSSPTRVRTASHARTSRRCMYRSSGTIGSMTPSATTVSRQS